MFPSAPLGSEFCETLLFCKCLHWKWILSAFSFWFLRTNATGKGERKSHESDEFRRSLMKDHRGWEEGLALKWETGAICPIAFGLRTILLIFLVTKQIVRNGHGTTDWFQIGKEYIKAVYCHPAYLTYMQSTSWEILDWIKHELESKLTWEISITSDMQITQLLGQKVKKN